MKQTTNGFSLGRVLSNADDIATTTVMILVENKEKQITLRGIEGLTILASSTEFVAATTTIAQSIANSLSAGTSVVKEYVSVKMSAVVGYFDTVYAKVMHTDKLCVGETCVNEEQLKALLNNQNSSSAVIQVQVPSSTTNQQVLGASTSIQGVSNPDSSTSTTQSSLLLNENLLNPQMNASSTQQVVTQP